MSATTLMETTLFHKVCFTACTLVSLILASPAQAEEGSGKLEEQRRLFESAHNALQHGDVNSFRRMESRLADYPLYPYLRYDYLRTRLSQPDGDEVHAFLEQFPDTSVTPALRRAWLAQLARRGAWKSFVTDYVSTNDEETRCQYASALIHTGATEQAWAELDDLWFSAHTQPSGCNSAFEAWRDAGQMTRDKVLARMELAIDHKQTRLVNRLAEYLPRGDRPWVQRWQRMYRSPEAELRHLEADADRFWSSKLFLYGVRRLASIDAEAADGFWASRGDYDLTPEQVARGDRAVALNLTLQRYASGYQRLAVLAARGRDMDRDMRQWRVRGALWQQDWTQVLAAIDALTSEEQAQEDWQYWRGRALESLGRQKDAQSFYTKAAEHRSYYGFLAAARLRQAPNIVSEPLDVSEVEQRAFEQMPSIQRVREFNALGMNIEARREWRDALSRMEPRALRVAAKMAHGWGWYDSAILALGRTEYLNDLEVRFPTPYREQVQNHAAKRNLDPAFVYALMRQESAFGVQARSPVGALGLMQLMPATAKRTARSIRERVPSKAELLTAEKNIRIGTAYLSELLEKYRGNRFFTLAAYNAGPQRVARWQPSVEPMPADIWVENVTFAETREYVERILAYTAVYEWRLGRTVTPFTDWMADAPPRLIREASSDQKHVVARLSPRG